MRYITVIFVVTALACLVQLAAATPAGGLPRSTRKLLQTAAEADAAMVKALQKIQHGDEKERETLVNMQYYYLGCGGKTRQRDPEELANNMIGNIKKNPAFIKGGVVKTWTDIIEEALAQAQDSPPSSDDCDNNPYFG